MIDVNVNFNNITGKIKPMHATNNMVTLPRNGATDGSKKGIAIVNNRGEEIAVSVNANVCEGAKIYSVDEENDFVEVGGAVSSLTLPADGIKYVEIQ